MLNRALWVFVKVIATFCRWFAVVGSFLGRLKRRSGSDRKRVVILGAGFGGCVVARTLQNEPNLDVILLTPKPYFEFTPGILSAFSETDTEYLQSEISNFLPKVCVIIGTATCVFQERVHVRSKHDETFSLSYDYLVCATGSSYNMGKISGDNVINDISVEGLKRASTWTKNSSTVLIIGGGIVGIELAAELKHVHGDKIFVNIVHSGSRIMQRLDHRLSDYVEAFFYQRYKGVSILCDRNIVSVQGTDEFVTDQGEAIQADIAFYCAGPKPVTSYLEHSFGDKLTEQKYVRVNEYLQMDGVQNIYAIGDIASINEEKSAANAQEHAKVATHNILASLKRRSALKRYTPHLVPPAMIISLGSHGILLINGVGYLHGRAAALIKKVFERFWMIFYCNEPW